MVMVCTRQSATLAACTGGEVLNWLELAQP
jgi:hypothetical protein